MKPSYLLPNHFKRIGWLIFVPISIIGILWLIFNSDMDLTILNCKVFAIVSNQGLFNEADLFAVIENDISDEIIGILFIISSVFIVFSKEQNEDEYIRKIRLDSLVWSIYVNYAILILAMVFVYDLPFFWVLVFNMFTVLIFFIIRYNWAMYKFKKSTKNEE